MAEAKAFDPARVPVQPAATLMLLDDRPELEVLLLRRRAASDFVPGMYVFPGGRVDAEDAADEAVALCRGLEATEANARLGVARDGLGFWVAAIRETLEEAGVLFAAHAPDGRALDLTDAETAARVEALRIAVDRGHELLAEGARDAGFSLSLDTIHYVARWITPEGPTRRYDTRFFLAAMPAGQHASHDDDEAVDSLWAKPADALDRFASGVWPMFPPTVGMLRLLASYPSRDAAVAAAARAARGPEWPAKLATEGESWRIVLPADPDYEATPPGEIDAWVRLPAAPRL
jgi:8-oxo-dGTP pyrophosphatase MutT (NUDIX family)